MMDLDLDGLVEKVVLYAFIAGFAVIMYLFLGNGYSDLSLLQFGYPYQAIVTIPSWGAFVGFFSLYLLLLTTDQEQIVKELGSLLLFLSAIGWWTRALQTTLLFPTSDNKTTLILYSIGLAGTGLLFYAAWHKRLSRTA
jgi:hypothetical protein